MIPAFINHMQSQDPVLRADAIHCINQFIAIDSQSFLNHADKFLTALFSSATDDAADVRKNVCQGLVLLLSTHPEKILPSLEGIVQFMLHSTQDYDENVATEACEFWLVIAESELCPSLSPYLPQIVPVLLSCMVYSEMKIMSLGGDEDDAHVEDRLEDMKPLHHRAKSHHPAHEANAEKDDIERERRRG